VAGAGIDDAVAGLQAVVVERNRVGGRVDRGRGERGDAAGIVGGEAADEARGRTFDRSRDARIAILVAGERVLRGARITVAGGGGSAEVAADRVDRNAAGQAQTAGGDGDGEAAQVAAGQRVDVYRVLRPHLGAGAADHRRRVVADDPDIDAGAEANE